MSCTALPFNITSPSNFVIWYWKFVLYVLYGIGRTIARVLFLEFIIAQSPDKLKGFVIGIALAFRGFVYLVSI